MPPNIMDIMAIWSFKVSIGELMAVTEYRSSFFILLYKNSSRAAVQASVSFMS